MRKLVIRVLLAVSLSNKYRRVIKSRGEDLRPFHSSRLSPAFAAPLAVEARRATSKRLLSSFSLRGPKLPTLPAAVGFAPSPTWEFPVYSVPQIKVTKVQGHIFLLKFKANNCEINTSKWHLWIKMSR